MGELSEPIIRIGGVLDITAEVITMFAILAVVTVIALIIRHNLKERPGKFQNMIETGVEYLDNFFTDLMGKRNARKYLFLSLIHI